jgi:hypothetical protein
MNYKKNAKNVTKYICEKCDFKSSNKTDYNRHLLTAKHKYLQNSYEKDEEDENGKKLFKCICGKGYKHRQSLYTHQTKCNYEHKPITGKLSEELITKFMYTQLEENKELRNILLEQNSKIIEMLPKIGNTNNTINNTNSNNKQQFNIQVFLNEECKNAMNMSEFIKSIKVSFEQLDFTKREGLEQGLSNIILKNISSLNVNERPIHCTDTKRETIYVKEDDKWEKDKDKSMIKNAIRDISHKNYHTLKEWMDDNPNYSKIDDKQDFFARTISVIGKPLSTVDDKVIKKICLNTYVKDRD